MTEETQPLLTHVLLVEDEPGLQEALSLVFEMEGYVVTRAADGRAGLERVSERRPDLILTDYSMPHMNGVEMIERIRANPDYAGIPIVLYSAALPASIDPTKVADAYLRKPVGIDQLLATVERLLGNAASSER